MEGHRFSKMVSTRTVPASGYERCGSHFRRSNLWRQSAHSDPCPVSRRGLPQPSGRARSVRRTPKGQHQTSRICQENFRAFAEKWSQIAVQLLFSSDGLCDGRPASLSDAPQVDQDCRGLSDHMKATRWGWMPATARQILAKRLLPEASIHLGLGVHRFSSWDQIPNCFAAENRSVSGKLQCDSSAVLTCT